MALLQVQEGRSALSSVADSGSQHAQQDPTAAPGAWQQFLHGGLPAAHAAAANDAQPGFGSDPRAGDGAQAWAASHRGRTQVYHYQLDHLGTPRELTSSDGRIVWSAQYRAWGQLALADVQEIEAMVSGLHSPHLTRPLLAQSLGPPAAGSALPTRCPGPRAGRGQPAPRATCTTPPTSSSPWKASSPVARPLIPHLRRPVPSSVGLSRRAGGLASLRT